VLVSFPQNNSQNSSCDDLIGRGFLIISLLIYPPGLTLIPITGPGKRNSSLSGCWIDYIEFNIDLTVYKWVIVVEPILDDDFFGQT
jgi:hypothetical protein